MLQLINELKDIPGVIGACTYSPQNGLQESNLPGIFKPEKLAAIGRQFTKLYTVGQMNFSDLTELTLNYDESVVVARTMQNNNLVFVICDPSFNHNLLSMSLNLLQEELHGDLMAAEDEDSVGKPLVGTFESSKTEKSADRDLTILFESLREHLAKIVGPMAKIIFDEAVDEWQKQGVGDESRLESLLDLLKQEIVDPEKIEHYQELIEPALQAFQDR